MGYLVIAARCLLGGTFLLSVIGKARGADAFGAFEASVRSMPAPRWLSTRLVAVTVTAAEASACVLLLLPLPGTARWGAAGAGILLSAFTVVIVLALRRGVRTPCGCFGATATPLGWRHVVRNTVLTCVALIVLAGAPAAGRSQFPGAATAVAAGLVAALLVASLDDLLDLLRPPGRGSHALPHRDRGVGGSHQRAEPAAGARHHPAAARTLRAAGEGRRRQA